MKILNFPKNTKLALLFFLLILLNNFTESFSSSNNINNINNNIITNQKNQNPINNLRFQGQKKFNKKTHLKKFNKFEKIKNNKNSENSRNTNITEEQLQFIENMTKSQQKNDSFMYASWFIFVPLVLLIFVMTILSIAGFLILILNSTNANSSLDKKEILRNQINNLNRGNLSNQEILDILRKKSLNKNKKQKTNMNYKPEPEPETVLLGI